MDIFLLPLHVSLELKCDGESSRSHLRLRGVPKKYVGHILRVVKQNTEECGAEVTAGRPHHPCTAHLDFFYVKDIKFLFYVSRL